jgi:hypothetical protein
VVTQLEVMFLEEPMIQITYGLIFQVVCARPIHQVELDRFVPAQIMHLLQTEKNLYKRVQQQDSRLKMYVMSHQRALCVRNQVEEKLFRNRTNTMWQV